MSHGKPRGGKKMVVWWGKLGTQPACWQFRRNYKPTVGQKVTYRIVHDLSRGGVGHWEEAIVDRIKPVIFLSKL